MNTSFNVRYVPVDTVRPYSGNPRLNTNAVEPVANSIREFGWQQPIVVDRDNVVIAGHTRLLAAKTLGLTEVPVVVAENLTEEQARAYRLADNRTAENAEWDSGLLVDELLTLKDSGIDLTLTAFTQPELDALLNPAPPVPPSTLGDSFIVPPFSVLHGGNPKWVERKKRWVDALDLKSGESREDATCMPKAVSAGHLHMEGNTGGVSIFDAVLAEVIVSWFSAPGDRVIDNYAGGSVRGAISAMLGRHYTGIDVRQEQVDANYRWLHKQQPTPSTTVVEDAARQDPKQNLVSYAPRWVCGDGTTPAQTVPETGFDFAFTCPPYGDLEVYSDHPDDISNKGYDEFRDLYFRGAKQLYTMLKDDAFAAVVVGEFRGDDGAYNNFVGDTIKAYLDAGFKYYNEVIYETPLGTLILRARGAFTKSRKDGKTHQNLLVFSKGDVRKTNAVKRNEFTNIDPTGGGVEQ